MDAVAILKIVVILKIVGLSIIALPITKYFLSVIFDEFLRRGYVLLESDATAHMRQWNYVVPNDLRGKRIRNTYYNLALSAFFALIQSLIIVFIYTAGWVWVFTVVLGV